MIEYESGGIHYVLKIFKTKGSVFPNSLLVAIPCATLAVLLRYFINIDKLPILADTDSILSETQAWSGFSFLVGFLIVFRTSQAYNRFWDGCTATHQMRAEWCDAASALVAFCRAAEAPDGEVMRFKHILIRLFSMLHVVALAELEEINQQGQGGAAEHIKAYSFELFDAIGIDEQSLHAIRESGSKVELIFSWIQLLIVEQIQTGVLAIPSPILSRAFQEIANGMVAFHDALKITYIPFPFPYAQTCDCLLLLHWIVVPFVTSQWVSYPPWAGIFVFIQVFILWSLNFIAVEIENPFGTDSNDLNGDHMQQEMNRNLELLLQPATTRVPTLAPSVQVGRDSFARLPSTFEAGASNASFAAVWNQLDDWDGLEEHEAPVCSARRGQVFENCKVDKVYRKTRGKRGSGGSMTHVSTLDRSGSGSVIERMSTERDSTSSRSSRSSASPKGDRHSFWIGDSAQTATARNTVGRRTKVGGEEVQARMSTGSEAPEFNPVRQSQATAPGVSRESRTGAGSEQLNISGEWEAVARTEGLTQSTDSAGFYRPDDSGRRMQEDVADADEPSATVPRNSAVERRGLQSTVVTYQLRRSPTAEVAYARAATAHPAREGNSALSRGGSAQSFREPHTNDTSEEAADATSSANSRNQPSGVIVNSMQEIMNAAASTAVQSTSRHSTSLDI